MTETLWPDNERCETCKYWREPKIGICRRYPPITTLGEEGSTSTEWSFTLTHDWCGEWENGKADGR